MHLVAETFFTLHLRRWEAAQAANELHAMVHEHGIEVADYPALDTLFGSLCSIAEVDAGSPVVSEGEIAQDALDGLMGDG